MKKTGVYAKKVNLKFVEILNIFEKLLYIFDLNFSYFSSEAYNRFVTFS